MIGSTMGYHFWKFPCPVIRDDSLCVLLEIIGQSIAGSLLVIYIQSAKTLCWAMVLYSTLLLGGASSYKAEPIPTIFLQRLKSRTLGY